MSRSAALVTMLLALALVAAPPVTAQSITAAAVAGTVRGPDGALLGAVQVTLSPLAGGIERVVETDGSGRFLLSLVAPGHYTLLVERLGYRPLLVTPLPLLPGRREDVHVTLEPAPGAVVAPDTILFDGVALAAGSRPGRDRTVGEWELRSVPTRDGQLEELVLRSSLGERSLEVEGLPASMGRYVLAGVPYTPARHVGAGVPGLETLVAPVRALSGVELLAGRRDMEWPGAAGALLSAMLRPPPAAVGGDAEALWSGGGMVLDDGDLGSPASWRAGGRVGTVLAGDSAHVWGFAEAEQRGSPVRFWPAGADAMIPGLGGAGVDVADLGRFVEGSARRMSAGGAFDWNFPGGLRVDAAAFYSRGELDHLPATIGTHDLPGQLDASDLVAAAQATTDLSDVLAMQLRVGFTTSSREHAARTGGTGLGAATVLFAPELAQLSGDPAYPANMDRNAFSFQGVLHYRDGDHHVKGGLGAEFQRHDWSHTSGRGGTYTFDGPESLATRTGLFTGVAGPAGSASFGVNDFFGFLQNAWRLAPGLDLTTGARYDVTTLPVGDLVTNRRWRELTGIDNADVRRTSGHLGVVAAFDWDLQEQHVWRLRGAVALQRGGIEPHLLNEALTHDGQVRITAAVGDVNETTELGPRLAILAPGIQAPVTTRASLGVSRALGSTTALHLGAVVRQTDNLPIRRDLNRPIEAPFSDQYGRPVFGELIQVGGLLAVEAGTNRRFGEFDAVSAISSAGSSTYWGVTAGIERHVGALRVGGSYTYSRTEDDWYQAAAGTPHAALPPFAGVAELERWTEGTSDFDVPHRIALATELTVPVAPFITIGAALHRSSGRPFTPGFGLGIDANGDGVAGNDPAFVDPDIPGMSDLIRDWECLRANTDRFVERNACRTPARSLLDAWAAIRLQGPGGLAGELRLEALGLDEQGGGRYDSALLHLDPAHSVQTDPATGRVTVPLVANPRFGQEIVPAHDLTRVRIGLRLFF